MNSYLADVNFWLALTYTAHIHYGIANEWFESGESAVFFCRITQKALLRLLTNRSVMRNDVLTAARAWEHYDKLILHPQVRFLTEPPGLEKLWREATRDAAASPNFWTNAYLSAFALAGGLPLLTFDRQLARKMGDHARLLS